MPKEKKISITIKRPPTIKCDHCQSPMTHIINSEYYHCPQCQRTYFVDIFKLQYCPRCYELAKRHGYSEKKMDFSPIALDHITNNLYVCHHCDRTWKMVGNDLKLWNPITNKVEGFS
jgi:Zn finger protein HypA/HybF involved in hydrogenase expression